MTAASFGLLVLLWTGTTLVLSGSAWSTPTRWEARVAPYLPGATVGRSAADRSSPHLVADALRPIAEAADRLATKVGIGPDLELRLERVHSPLGAADARLRQVAITSVALAATVVGGAFVLPGSGFVIALAVVPTATFLTVDRRATEAALRWQRDVVLELPIAPEHLAVLLGAGYSLGGALEQTAARSTGACGSDLTRVCSRIRQGMAEYDALAEWAEIVDVAAVRQLVATLTLSRQTGDLARLVSAETDAIRSEGERQLTADIQRRAQRVWIPVAIAALIPGSVFIAIPFAQALHTFTGP